MNRNQALNLKWEYEGAREVCDLSGFVSVPGSYAGDQFPVILYNQQQTASNASQSATTLITAPITGTYRITLQASLTVVGTAGATQTMACSIVATDPAASGSQTTAVCTWTTDTGNSNNGTLGKLAIPTTGFPINLFRCKAGTAIQFSTTASGGSTYPTLQIAVLIECLGA